MDLTTGEEISLEGLLYALMMQSSNDAAVAIAEHVMGSVEDFCYAMTLKARELGALDTSFITPSGLDAENHYSTAHDLAVIARYALRNEKFTEIINTINYTVKSSKRTYDIQNKNRFLYEYEGALGIKTGFTGGAGNCFVGAAEQDGMRFITVVLGSGWGEAGKRRRWADTRKMMDYAFANYK
jgi:D-alanyl-D-alanine carboxypeptidase (penicillin-binding protein 5/6)